MHLGKSVPSTVSVAALVPELAVERHPGTQGHHRHRGGDPIEGVTELRTAIADSGAGKPLTIDIQRDGKTRDGRWCPN